MESELGRAGVREGGGEEGGGESMRRVGRAR